MSHPPPNRERSSADSARLRKTGFDISDIAGLLWTSAAAIAVWVVRLQEEAIDGYEINCIALPQGGDVEGEIGSEFECAACGGAVAEPPVQDRASHRGSLKVVHDLAGRAVTMDRDTARLLL